jgi:hypothetical protein
VSDLRQIILRHDQYITSTVGEYKRKLEVIVAEATARTLAELARKLNVGRDGVIANTAGNQRILRSLDRLFTDQMERAGFSALNEAYAKQFAGQLPFLDDILDTISASLNTPLPDVRDIIKADDQRFLASQQLGVVDNLQGVVDQIAGSAKRMALMSSAGLPVSDLAAMLADAFGKTVAQAETIADTGSVIFWRTINDRAYEAIQKELPGFEMRYEYEGPVDDLIRPFCLHLMSSHKSYTRSEIDRMSNGSLPNVFITCGSWNCRHSWALFLPAK